MRTRISLVAAAGCLLAAMAVGEIDRGGITRGVLQNDGQLEVAGVVYDAGNAMEVRAGCIGGSAGLEAGQVVEVHGMLNGSLAAGLADTVTYRATVAGPVQSYDQGELYVLGQRVLVTADTVLATGLQPQNLMPGASVEVSGFHVARGAAIAATWIGTGAETSCVTGPLAAFDSATGRFVINGLTGTLPAGARAGLHAGSWISVRGDLVHGELRADKVDILPDAWSAAGDLVVFDGLVAAVGYGWFQIGEIVFHLDTHATISGGDGIGMGDSLLVAGTGLADGEVHANDIVIYRKGLVQIPQAGWDDEGGGDDDDGDDDDDD